MKPYEKYKDSGVEWIGKIPEHWEVRKIKFITKFKNGLAHEQEIDESGEYIVVNSRFVSTEGAKKKYCNQIMQPLHRGEICIVMSDVPNGRAFAKCFLVEENNKYSLNQRVGCFYNIDLDNKFFFYFMNRNKELLFFDDGLNQTNLRKPDLMAIHIVFPPNHTEQYHIVDYVNFEAKKIDDIISTRQRQIELLNELKSSIINKAVTKGINPDVKMKDSGIKWIGEIPEHWEVRKIKTLCRNEKYSIKTGPFGTQLKGDDLQIKGDVCVYNQKNIIYKKFDEIQYYVSSKKAKELNSFHTKSQDLLLTTRGTIGRCAILPKNAPMGIIHPCLIALRIDQRISLLSWMQLFINESDGFKVNVFLNSNATTIEVIYTDTIKNVYIPIPSLCEQEKIISYIETKIAKIDLAISKYQQQIDLLKEYRSSLITEAVTGKIDVRNFRPNTQIINVEN